MPRIQKVELAPGSPERCTEITPASWPARLLEILAVGIRMSLTETEAIDPTTLAFFCVPYPTTTTSESTVEVSCNVMFSGDFVVASIGTSTLCNPTYEKTRVSPGATSMTY